MSTILTTQKLTKRYGKFTALDDLNIEVKRGQVFGLLGPNGSGKTTTLGIVLGVTTASGGRYSWFDAGQGAGLRTRVGSLLEAPNFYPWFSGAKNLRMTAVIRRIAHPEKMIEEVLARVGLARAGAEPVSAYSLGMKARLALAAAMLGRPEVLVLDEPTNGIDAQGIKEVRDTITDLAREGTTIILASHILDEVEKVCSDIAILKAGKLLDQGAIRTVLGGHDCIEVGAEDAVRLSSALNGFPCREIKEHNGHYQVYVDKATKVSDLSRHLYQQQVIVTHLVQHQRSLESHFLELLER